MLNTRLKDFILEPNGMGLGTRDANLTPDFSRVLGAVAVDDQQIRVFIDEKTSTRALQNMTSTGLMSVVIVHMLTYESYQFKGRYVRTEQMTQEDMDMFGAYMLRFNEAAEKIGLKGDLVFNYAHSSMIALVMEVDAIFDQTPRKGTGHKV